MAQSSMEEIESNKRFGVFSVVLEFLQTQSAGGREQVTGRSTS